MNIATLVLLTATATATETCRILPCAANMNAQCVDGKCVCGPGTNWTANGSRCEADGTTSLGDRLVLERQWIGNATVGGAYDPLPLNASAARAAGWNVSSVCVPGRGKEAIHPTLFNSALHLWYDQLDFVIGYEIVVTTTTLNRDICRKQAGGGSRCAVMFRKADQACGASSAVRQDRVPGSIGDRLFLPYWDGEIPLTNIAAAAHSPPFVDTKECLVNMGHHFVAPLLSTNPLMPMYYEKSGIIDGLLIVGGVAGVTAAVPSPPFEKFAAFKNAMSLHVYFKEHMGACTK